MPGNRALDERGIERSELDDKIPSHQQGAKRKDDVTRHTHPLPEERCLVKIEAAGEGIAVLIYGQQLRPTDRKEIKTDPENQAEVIKPEGPQADRVAERPAAGDVAQAEINQANPQFAEGAEQRGMRMSEGEERSVLIVIYQRRVERAATEHAGTDEVPECGPDDEGIGKTVIEIGAGLDEPVLLDGFGDEQNQRQHFDKREHAAAGSARHRSHPAI